MKFNLENLIRDNIKRMKPYSSARDEFKQVGNTMIFMDANENPFDTGLNRYPDPQQTKLKQLIAKQKGLSLEQILLGNGSDEILDLIFRAFCEPNKDSVLFCPPTYGMYEVLANINAISMVRVPLSKNFQLNMEAILNAILPSTRLLMLCSPNNPTGNSLEREDIELILREFQGIVVIDEAYIDFSDTESWIKRLKEFKNLIVTQTVSKALGLAGIRLGMCFASREIISVLNIIKPPYNVNELTQQKAIEVLNNQENLMNQVRTIQQERKKLEKKLMEIPFVENVFPSNANFLLVKVDEATKRYEQLIEKGIVVRNRTKEPGCKNCLRITVGTPEENEVLIYNLASLP